MSLLSEWKVAKKNFETATGKKKPSAKFLGVFNKSGVEDVLKALDSALDKGDPKAMEKALEAAAKSAGSYYQTLAKAEKEDKDSNYITEVKKLSDELSDIVTRAGVMVNTAIRQAKEDEAETGLKQATEIAGKTETGVNTLLSQMQSELRAAGKLGEAADEALRATIDAQTNGDSKTAKTEAVKIQTAVKSLEAAAKKIDGIRTKAQTGYQDGKSKVAKLKLDPKLYGGKDPTARLFDKAEAVVIKMDDLVEEANSELSAAREALNEAAAALKGTLNAEATYLKSVEKLAKRATDAAMKYDGIVRDLGGQADRAGQEAITAGEAQDKNDEEGKAQAIKSAKFYITQVNQQANQAVTEINDAARDLIKTRQSLPDFVKDGKPFAASLATVEDMLKSLQESRNEAQKALTKAERAEKALEKLA